MSYVCAISMPDVYSIILGVTALLGTGFVGALVRHIVTRRKRLIDELSKTLETIKVAADRPDLTAGLEAHARSLTEKLVPDRKVSESEHDDQKLQNLVSAIGVVLIVAAIGGIITAIEAPGRTQYTALAGWAGMIFFYFLYRYIFKSLLTTTSLAHEAMSLTNQALDQRDQAFEQSEASSAQTERALNVVDQLTAFTGGLLGGEFLDLSPETESSESQKQRAIVRFAEVLSSRVGSLHANELGQDEGTQGSKETEGEDAEQSKSDA